MLTTDEDWFPTNFIIKNPKQCVLISFPRPHIPYIVSVYEESATSHDGGAEVSLSGHYIDRYIEFYVEFYIEQYIEHEERAPGWSLLAHTA